MPIREDTNDTTACGCFVRGTLVSTDSAGAPRPLKLTPTLARLQDVPLQKTFLLGTTTMIRQISSTGSWRLCRRNALRDVRGALLLLLLSRCGMSRPRGGWALVRTAVGAVGGLL